jgi:hypothetical protein
MTINNPLLYNGIISGLNGSQQRWLAVGASYVQFRNVVESIAQIIDSKIPPFPFGTNLTDDAKLLQGIVSEVFSGRPLPPITEIDYTDISLSIANFFLQMRVILAAVPPAPFTTSLFIGSMTFNATTGTSILGALVPGTIFALSQFTIDTLFGIGSRIRLGTSTDLGHFIDVTDPEVASYANDLVEEILLNDFLVLTVNAVGPTGSGTIYFGEQLS